MPSFSSMLLIALAVLATLNLLLLVQLLRRTGADEDPQAQWQWLQTTLATLARDQQGGTERIERELRGAVQTAARDTRVELGSSLAAFQRVLMAQSGEVARAQNEQIDSFRVQLAAMQTGMDQRLAGLQGGIEQRLVSMQGSVEQRLNNLQGGVEQRLASLQADNEKKLEQMRATVDEKLHATLEARLGESFKQVADRLEQVHRGLGEMQTLAQGVGDLKRVLTNVKARGVFGEVQLAGLLEQVLTHEQYAVNVATVPGSNERVEFAIKLPGRAVGGAPDAPVWLPIDAKFPREDYERLLDAHDRADREAAESAAKALEQRIRDEARTIQTKYVSPPHTTDFAILFLPTEGLYAELLRRPGLTEALQRQYRVTLAGPTTLLAMLNSLQMGFRTLALEQRSSEVWSVLGAVKTEFAKFGDVLAKTKKKLLEAHNTIDDAEVRARSMARKLKSVEALPEPEARALLPVDPGAGLDAQDEAAA